MYNKQTVQFGLRFVWHIYFELYTKIYQLSKQNEINENYVKYMKLKTNTMKNKVKRFFNYSNVITHIYVTQ